jgi:putative oxidoreductase
MEDSVTSFSLLIGRVCLSLVYLVSGLHKGIYFEKALDEFQNAGIPFANIAVIVIVIFHIIAASFLIVGVFVSESALALAIFTFVATWRTHSFWVLPGGSERLLQSRFALAHLAVIGGLLILSVIGPGKFSLAP